MEYRVIEKGKQYGKVTTSPQTAYNIQQRLWHRQEGCRNYGQAAYVQKRRSPAEEWKRVNIAEEV